MSKTCPSCGNPESEHIWMSEEGVTSWIPEPGFKKNSCARYPGPGSTKNSPDLLFKVWSPALTKYGPMPGLDLGDILPCPFCGCTETEEVMNDGEVALECLHCHATGPYVDDHECPTEAWNSRYGGSKENRW